MNGVAFKLNKAMFFDRKVVNSFDKAGMKVLSRFGAYVRRSSRSSIRKKKNPSKPGQPPRSVTGILKGISGREPGIFFVVDPKEKSVIIGPSKGNQVFFNHHREPVQGTIPQVLEEGGEIRILEAKYGEKWYRADLRSKKRLEELETRLRKVRIAPRPYMKPAFDKNLPKLREWKGALK